MKCADLLSQHPLAVSYVPCPAFSGASSMDTRRDLQPVHTYGSARHHQVCYPLYILSSRSCFSPKLEVLASTSLIRLRRRPLAGYICPPRLRSPPRPRGTVVCTSLRRHSCISHIRMLAATNASTSATSTTPSRAPPSSPVGRNSGTSSPRRASPASTTAARTSSTARR